MVNEKGTDMSQTMRVVSVQVGDPQTHHEHALQDGREIAWSSGIFKAPVQGRVWVGRINLDGDGQADLKNHGGPDRPVLAYSVEHYAEWKQEFEGRDWPSGSFGENITVSGLNERTVCLGDQYRIGEVLLEVSQPRVPCWKLGRRHGLVELPARVLETVRTGWYLRVLQEGFIEAGDAVEFLARPCPEWTIVRAHQVRLERKVNRDAARELAACPYLSQGWKAMLVE